MEYMSGIPDKYFDLAIVDPPYGIGMGGGKVGNSKKDYKQFAGNDNCIPDAAYFTELMRVSNHQIIWGGELHDRVFSSNILFFNMGQSSTRRFYYGYV